MGPFKVRMQLMFGGFGCPAFLTIRMLNLESYNCGLKCS